MIHQITILTLMVSMASIFLAYLDYIKIINDVEITKKSKVVRGVIMLFANTCFWGILHVNYGTSPFIALYAQTVYWIVFDAALNRFRGKSILYTSNNNRDDNDSIFDKVFNFLPNPYSGLLQLVVKIVLIVLFLII